MSHSWPGSVSAEIPALAFRGVTFAYPEAEGGPVPGDGGVASAFAGAPDRAGTIGGHVEVAGPSGAAALPAPVLAGVSFEVPQGAFALLCGATGSGKSTVLRLAKPEVAPAGRRVGAVELFGRDVGGLAPVDSARAAGLVLQDPDAQLVCDSVWHELAFGLENLGCPEPEMRRRVAETCMFLGIEPWFRRQVEELSGGQRQILALAATLAMRPRLLLLDEPTSMLDPVSAASFLSLLFRANRELGITVVVATHAPWQMANYATCAFEVAGGKVSPRGLEGLSVEPELVVAPEGGPSTGASCPGSSRAASPGSSSIPAPAVPGRSADDSCVRLDDAWLRYGHASPWVLRSCGLEVIPGEVRALVGANGCGKSTLLSCVAGLLRPQRGRVSNALASSQALLPQAPRALLSCETVREELFEWSATSGVYGPKDVEAALARLGLEGFPERHPYDLSGGQQQLLALEKLLLVRPRLLLLDEPTKGLDLASRTLVARRVREAAETNTTVVVATHDLAFVRAVADRVSLMFDGGIACTETTADYVA